MWVLQILFSKIMNLLFELIFSTRKLRLKGSEFLLLTNYNTDGTELSTNLIFFTTFPLLNDTFHLTWDLKLIPEYV